MRIGTRLALLSASATDGPRTVAAVLPIEGGRFRSTVQGPDPAQAMKAFANDADITCRKHGGGVRMPWLGKPPASKFPVVSQDMKTKDGKQIKTDSKTVDAGIAVGLRCIGLASRDAVAVTTVFKCE